MNIDKWVILMIVGGALMIGGFIKLSVIGYYTNAELFFYLALILVGVGLAALGSKKMSR